MVKEKREKIGFIETIFSLSKHSFCLLREGYLNLIDIVSTMFRLKEQCV